VWSYRARRPQGSAPIDRRRGCMALAGRLFSTPGHAKRVSTPASGGHKTRNRRTRWLDCFLLHCLWQQTQEPEFESLLCGALSPAGGGESAIADLGVEFGVGFPFPEPSRSDIALNSRPREPGAPGAKASAFSSKIKLAHLQYGPNMTVP
jgi:hypothetical protein